MFRNLTITALAALVAVWTGQALAQETLENIDSPARGRIGLLEQRVADLETQTTRLAAQLAEANTTIAELGTRLADAEAAVAALQGSPIFVLAEYVASLADCISVDTVLRDINRDGIDDQLPRVLVEGCNVQIVDGTGSTVTNGLGPLPSGLGNLIVGYDEAWPEDNPALGYLKRCSVGSLNNNQTDNQAGCEAAGGVWALNHKNGAHNLVVGVNNRYSQTGGVVFGLGNTVNNLLATVTGGDQNTASGNLSSISGGFDSTASGQFSSVSGGNGNKATEYSASVSGGLYNNATAMYASVSGGRNNNASGQFSSVSGGWSRAAGGEYDWAAGALLEDN